MRIDHRQQDARFVAVVEGREARLEYTLLPRGGIDFTYTFVPEDLRGRGIAEQLVRTALAWARQQGYSIEASCWYVRRFLKQRLPTME